MGIGASSDADTYITASEGDYKADFEVDFMTSVGPTFNAPANEVDALIGDHTGSSPSLVEFGETDQSGSVATDEAGLGIEYAYLNRNTDSTGAEWKVPFDAIGASSANDIEVRYSVASCRCSIALGNSTSVDVGPHGDAALLPV